MELQVSAVSSTFLFITLCMLRGTNGLLINQTQSVIGREGDTVIMNCTVSNETLGPVCWSKEANLQKILYSEKFGDKSDTRATKIVHEGQERDTDFSISFKNITLEDAGIYYCGMFKSDNVTVFASGSGTQLYVIRNYGLSIYQTSSVNGTEGGTVTMKCTVSCTTLGSVRWYKGEKMQKLVYSQLLIDKSDARISRTSHNGRERDIDFSITFRDITLEDAGVYYCVKFKSDKVTVAAKGSGTQLYVRSTYKPVVYQSQVVTATEGDIVIMNCTLSHETLGPVRWYKGDNLQKLLYSQLLSDESDARVSRTVHGGQEGNLDFSITFRSIRLEDAGMYYCVRFKSDRITVATSGPGTRLDVRRIKGQTIYQSSSVNGTEGDTIIMNCTVSHETLGPVRWYKGDTLQKLLFSQLLNDESDTRVSRIVHEGQERNMDFSIRFTSVTLEDAGIYYCVKFKSDRVTVAESGSGTRLHVSRTYSLMIYQTPSVTAEEGDTVIMNCTVSHNTSGPVRWYNEANMEKYLYSQLLGDKSDEQASRIVYEEQERNNDFSITFANITLKDAGVYYCVKFKSDKVTVAAKGNGTRLYVRGGYELVIYQPPAVTGVEGHSVIMQCALSQEIRGPVRWYKGNNLQKLLYSELSNDKSDARASRKAVNDPTSNTDYSITFTNITLEDAGVYYCVKFKSDKVTVAATGSGTRLYVSRGFDLMIYQTPSVTGIEGSTVKIQCTLSKETVGPVRWYKGSNLKKLLYSQLSDDNSDARVRQVVHEGPRRDTDHSITFTGITLEDAGVYYCVKFKSDGVTVTAKGSGTRLYITSPIPS
ncbi:basement membrane-specific heparan sulfate proteoglycan core protein-like isoform X1 [Protopterus annectens]|uniref:basement membrane-specific heparan sulfate proteoglycan core protein-like isoform X1 n=1 Tax=Protopterus annectens TaxID=7888 RepID=UPI001CFC1249|nr:basement membrane-specific heparan sulfate proteoglycan core protein-like isoform X1 [Protopterus annectens]